MKNKWLLWLVMYFSALCVSLSQFKVVTVLGDLANNMGVGMGQIAYLMSVFTLAGIILCVPGAAILAKLGPKKLLILLMTSLLVGNLIGAFATVSFPLMLVSRVLEGVAFAMIIMLGIVFISEWFADASNVGTAIAMYTTFPGLASGIMINASTPIASGMGLQSLWFVVGGLVLLALILVIAIIPNPQPARDQDAAAAPTEDRPSIGEAASNRKIWLLALCHGCVAFILFTFISIYPSIFGDFYSLEPGTANFYASLNGWFGIPFCILAGVILDKFKNAPLLILISFTCLTLACFITTHLTGTATYILHTLLTAMFTGLIISGNLAVAPTIAKRPALIGYSVAFVNLIYYIGIFIGTPLVLGAVEDFGWQAGTNVLTIVGCLGIVLALVFMFTSKKKASA